MNGGGGRREKGEVIEVVTRVSSMFDRRRPRTSVCASVLPSATGPFGTVTPRHCRLEVCVLCCPFKVLRLRGKCGLCSRNWRSTLLTFLFPSQALVFLLSFHVSHWAQNSRARKISRYFDKLERPSFFGFRARGVCPPFFEK